MTYDFTLAYAVAATTVINDALMDALFDAGCDDALIGLGRPGFLAFDFSRDGVNAAEALTSAQAAIQRVLPGAVLVEASPDLVNLADMAGLFGCTRQNMQKYSAALPTETRAPFPSPLVSSTPPLWRLLDVVRWAQQEQRFNLSPALVELAAETARLNLQLQLKKLETVA